MGPLKNIYQYLSIKKSKGQHKTKNQAKYLEFDKVAKIFKFCNDLVL